MKNGYCHRFTEQIIKIFYKKLYIKVLLYHPYGTLVCFRFVYSKNILSLPGQKVTEKELITISKSRRDDIFMGRHYQHKPKSRRDDILFIIILVTILIDVTFLSHTHHDFLNCISYPQWLILNSIYPTENYFR